MKQATHKQHTTPVRAGSKLARLTRRNTIIGDPNSIIHTDPELLKEMQAAWEKDWDELLPTGCFLSSNLLDSAAMDVERLECSLWTNGQSGWGVKILGGPAVRRQHFDRKMSPVIVEIDGVEAAVNIDKASFWNKTCGELIHKGFREFKSRHDLKPSERVWLRVLQPHRKFRLERT